MPNRQAGLSIKTSTTGESAGRTSTIRNPCTKAIIWGRLCFCTQNALVDSWRITSNTEVYDIFLHLLLETRHALADYNASTALQMGVYSSFYKTPCVNWGLVYIRNLKNCTMCMVVSVQMQSIILVIHIKM